MVFRNLRQKDAVTELFSIVADKIDINVWQAIELANHHPRVNILQPGPGVGGHCIAVDPWFIVDSAPNNTPLIQSARKVNDGKPEFIIEKTLVAASQKGARTVACLGLAYKADIDDFRESPAVYITANLRERLDGEVLVVEPNLKITNTKLLVKSGGKKGLWINPDGIPKKIKNALNI